MSRFRLLLIILIPLALSACQTNATDGSQPATSIADHQGKSTGRSADPSSDRKIAQASRKSGKRHYIEFRARYALTYGHSYVVFGRLNQAGQPVSRQVAGLHPATRSVVPYVLGHVVPVPSETGWSDGDLEDEYRSATWRVMLDEPDYTDLVSKIRKLQASSPVWHAALYNCNHFVADIAGFLGYKAPSPLLKPQQFIIKLREMNGGPNAIGYTGPIASVQSP